MIASLKDYNPTHMKYLLMGTSILLFGYSALKFTTMGAKHSGNVEPTVTRKLEPQGHSVQFAPVVDALLAEDTTASLARFGTTMSHLCTENGVAVQRIDIGDNATALGSDASKTKGGVLVTRNVDVTMTGSMLNIYRTLAMMSSTKLPFKLVNIDVQRAENNSESGSVTANVKAAVFTKGDAG